jgi:hypothetical protein
MTVTPPVPGTAAPLPAVVDGVDVDVVALAVQQCPAVSGLDGGRFGEVASYLPGRRVTGVVVGSGRVRVQVRSRWGVPAAVLARQITAALAPVTSKPVDVVIADIDDPPGLPPGAGPAAGMAGPAAAGPAPR